MKSDDLLSPYLERIARDWISYFSADESSRDEDPSLFNPWAVVEELTRYSPLYAWDLFRFILQEDRDGSTLDLLSAGPLEEFIELHGEGWIEEIEDVARNDAHFRSLLAGAWQIGTRDEVWGRVVAATMDAQPFSAA